MKKLLAVSLVVCICMMACQKSAPPTVDREAALKAVGELFDKYEKAFSSEDAQAFSETMDDNALFLGTDPAEFWSKDSVVSIMKQFAADTSVTVTFTITKRDIRLSDDGMTAVVTSQGIFPLVSNIIPVRGVAHARNKEGQWKIDYYSWAVIPKNEDVPKLNKALE